MYVCFCGMCVLVCISDVCHPSQWSVELCRGVQTSLVQAVFRPPQRCKNTLEICRHPQVHANLLSPGGLHMSAEMGKPFITYSNTYTDSCYISVEVRKAMEKYAQILIGLQISEDVYKLPLSFASSTQHFPDQWKACTYIHSYTHLYVYTCTHMLYTYLHYLHKYTWRSVKL